MKRSMMFFAGLVLISVGCVKTTRVVTDKDGNKTEEVTSWEPIALPVVVYDGPVVYTDDYYYRPPVVMYDRPYYPYYRSRYIHYGRPVHHVRTVHIGGERHYRGHGRHSHRHR